LKDVKPVRGPYKFISTLEVGAAIAIQNNSGKVAGTSGVVVEMLKHLERRVSNESQTSVMVLTYCEGWVHSRGFV